MDRWLQIYRSYSDAELAAELTWLRGQSRNIFNAQTEGNRSYARSTDEIKDRLAAATQATQERTNGGDVNRHLVADFSRVTQGRVNGPMDCPDQW